MEAFKTLEKFDVTVISIFSKESTLAINRGTICKVAVAENPCIYLSDVLGKFHCGITFYFSFLAYIFESWGCGRSWLLLLTSLLMDLRII